MIERYVLGAMLLGIVSLPAWAADSVYRHPMGFSVAVPTGWRTDVQQSGVNVIRDPAYVGVMVVHGSGPPAGLLEAMVSRVSSQWKQWQPLKRESCNFAGMSGACGWYTGIDPKGAESTLKVAAAGKDGKGYILFIAVPRKHSMEFARDLDAIERSFSLSEGDAAPSASVKQQLEALDKAYQSGSITTEDYERKRNALSGR